MIEWRNASSRGRPGAEFGEEPRAEAKRRQALGSELGNQEVREGLSGGGGVVVEMRLSSQATWI